MKLLFPVLALVTLSFTLSFTASANWFSGEGSFSAPHPIAFMSYADQVACESDGGRWEIGEYDEKLCWFDASDDVSVKLEPNTSEYMVKVETVGTNAHTCTFEGKGRWVDTGTISGIVATQEADDWVDDKLVPVTCELILHYVDGNTINVTNNEKCSSLCGMRARLQLEGAKRTGE